MPPPLSGRLGGPADTPSIIPVRVPFRQPEHQFASIGCEMGAGFFEHGGSGGTAIAIDDDTLDPFGDRSEEHTSELQSLMRISYAVFCLNKKTQNNKHKIMT